MFRYRKMFGKWAYADTLEEALFAIGNISGDKRAEIQEVIDGDFVKTEWVFSEKNRQGYRRMKIQYPLSADEME